MRKVVFVLGMGRSGTSALTRVLALRGAALPESLLEAHESNPAGHWEPLDALRLNEAFLERHGSDWWDPTLRLQEKGLTESEQDAHIEAIVRFLQECPPATLLAVKDPRISAMAEHWFEATRRAGYQPVCAIAIRHPSEVVASLAARNGTSAELGYVLWLKYNLLAESASRGLPRVFVSYSSLLEDWRREVARVERALNVELDASGDAEIDSFLQINLYRQRASEMIDADAASSLVVHLYKALWLAARDGPLDVAAVDGVFAEFRRYERLFRVANEDFQTRFATTVPARSISWTTLDESTLLQISQAEIQSADSCMCIDDVAIDGRPVGGAIVMEPESYLTIRGWALDFIAGDVGAVVFATIGDCLVGAQYGFARSDVVATFANIRYLQSGFRFDIAMASMPSGISSLRIAMLGANRKIVYELSKTIEISSNRVKP